MVVTPLLTYNGLRHKTTIFLLPLRVRQAENKQKDTESTCYLSSPRSSSTQATILPSQPGTIAPSMNTCPQTSGRITVYYNSIHYPHGSLPKPSLTSSFTVPNSGSRALKWYLQFPSRATAALTSLRVTSPSLQRESLTFDCQKYDTVFILYSNIYLRP